MTMSEPGGDMNYAVEPGDKREETPESTPELIADLIHDTEILISRLVREDRLWDTIKFLPEFRQALLDLQAHPAQLKKTK